MPSLFQSILLALAGLSALAAAVPEAAKVDEFSSGLERRAAKKIIKQAQVVTTCKKRGQIALTFDDGVYLYENSISNYLTKEKAKGTFFVNGQNWRCIYDNDSVARLKKTYAEGHMIGSHSWSHANGTKLTEKQFTKQLELTEKALQKILGIKPKFFRAPYGSYNQMMRRVLAKRGYKALAMWDVTIEDANGYSLAQQKQVINQAAASYPKPHNILMHEVKETTAKEIVPYAVKKLRAKGYKLVTLAECLGESPYQSVGKPSARDASWTCEGTPLPGQA